MGNPTAPQCGGTSCPRHGPEGLGQAGLGVTRGDRQPWGGKGACPRLSEGNGVLQGERAVLMSREHGEAG